MAENTTNTTDTNDLTIVAGLDVGNGYLKGLAAPLTDVTHPMEIDVPSCAAIVTSTNDIKDEPADVADDLMNHLDASFDTPLIADASTRRFFGKRAITSSKVMEEFDVYSHLSKARQDLSPMLTLASVASCAVKTYWDKNHALPDDILSVNAVLTVALPIDEYKQFRDEYRSRYLSADHMVLVHNFETPVRVKIHVTQFQVIAEGASAQFAIKSYGPAFINAMLSDARNNGFTLDGITADDVMNSGNSIGIDIGEGTVNFPVYTDNQLNTDASMTFDEGYGSVLNRALDRLVQAGQSFKTRKELAAFIQTPPTAFNKGRHANAMKIITEEIEGFSQEVTMQYKKILANVGSMTDLTYVYGGGANPVKPVLYKQLIAASSMGGLDTAIPVFYLDSRYSRLLNREGLFTIAKKLAGAS